MNNFVPTPTLPQSNIEVEIEVIASILLDPNAIYLVAEILPVEAFYVSAHRDIYQAALSLYKHQKEVNLLTVTSLLADKDLLPKVGGRNFLASITSNCVGSYAITDNARILINKYTRRKLTTLSYEIDAKAHDDQQPLEWILENLEQQVLSITQLRNATGKGYWQKVDDVAFQRLCKELEEIEEIENAAQRDWLMRKLAKKWKFPNKKELLDFHAKWLDSQSKAKLYTAKEYFTKYGNRDQDWVVPGLVPTESVVVAYGDGGVGKTRFAFTLAKYACTGGQFTYDGAEIDPMNVLLIETDQGGRNTSKILEMQDFFADDMAANRLAICEEWTVGEFGRLKQMIKQHSSKLVIIDSLMSISTSSIYSENDTEYARPIIRLRHLAQELGCTFLLIHHCNANGEIRGTRAIKFSCDELWKLTRQRNEIEEFNVLTIEKSRSRGPGAYKFMYDDETWGWKFNGRMEDNILGGGDQNTSVMSRCIKFLKANRGIPYEALEVAERLNLNRDSVRRDLKRAANEGLVNSGRSNVNKRALVYYVGSRKDVNLSDQVISLSDQPVITSYAIPEAEYGLSDQVITENLKFLQLPHSNFSNQVDQLITSTSNVDTSTNPSDQPDLITSDQLITSHSKIEESVDQLSHSLTIEEPPKIDEVVSKPTPTKLPVIEVGGVYFSWSLNKKVKVNKLYSSAKKADVHVAGDAIAKPRLSLNDLYPLPLEDWQLKINQLAMYGSEPVKVVGFESNGRKYQVEFLSGRLESGIRPQKLSKPC